jgi:hypothetical protein
MCAISIIRNNISNQSLDVILVPLVLLEEEKKREREEERRRERSREQKRE